MTKIIEKPKDDSALARLICQLPPHWALMYVWEVLPFVPGKQLCVLEALAGVLEIFLACLGSIGWCLGRFSACLGRVAFCLGMSSHEIALSSPEIA
ncbi:hypothetical protein [Labilibaculum euxinus]